MRRLKRPSRVYKKRPRVSAYQPEFKHIDRFNTTTVTQTGSLDLLTGVTTQGTDDTQRIGDTIHAYSLMVRLAIIRNTASNYDNVRIMLVQDLQGTNAPIVTQILEPGFLGGGFAPFAPRNHYYLNRFRILFDRTVTLSLNMGVSKNFKHYMRINRRLEFIGASTFTGQVYLLVAGDNPNVLQLPIINWVTRLTYYD